MSAMSEKPNALTRFARKYCATWNEGDSLCSLGGFCKLAMNQRCGYFRESVFPICDPGYKFATETKLYPELLNRYSKIDPRVVQREAVIRICPDCTFAAPEGVSEVFGKTKKCQLPQIQKKGRLTRNS
jgi:hypothetical protein